MFAAEVDGILEGGGLAREETGAAVSCQTVYLPVAAGLVGSVTVEVLTKDGAV